MAIHYYDLFSSQWSSKNFGDDINPFLPKKTVGSFDYSEK